MSATPRVAVVGSGISGLAAARSLDRAGAFVTLLEAAGRFGGHTHTVDVEVDGLSHGVDTGFLVYNQRTYPKLIALFAELGVETAASDMSFSVQSPVEGIEWSGSDLRSVFAQRRNLVRPRFWSMLADIARFNRLATAEARNPLRSAQSVGDFLDAHRFSTAFRDWYFLPMVACIWSCPTERMLDFPIATLARFCDNHGLLQVTDRPPWFTVRGGARNYVAKILAALPDARASTPVLRVERRREGGVDVVTDAGRERHDAVVLACHSDQALALLAEPDADERRVLGAIRYHPNRAVLHTDTALLPSRPRAWAAWNYERGTRDGDADPVCLHYLLNRLQPLPFRTPVIVSLNPIREPDPARVLAAFEYAHPVLDAAAVAAQADLPSLQGRGGVWFAGAWAGHGFHEDGLSAGLAAADGVMAAWSRSTAVSASTARVAA